MKKIIMLVLIAILVFVTATGCGSQQEKEAGIKIVTTVFPEYDWAKTILGDNPSDAELILLTDKGVDIHSFQPSVEDIYNITTCDLLVYVGGESYGFIEDALNNASNENMTVINLMESSKEYIKEEETVEGMQAEEEEGEEEEPEYDEHVWLSLKIAPHLLDLICDGIVKVDPANEEYYKNNLEDIKTKLEALDEEYEKTVTEASNKTLLFADRFPFRYMFDDYGLDYYAAFAGCSTETAASFETMTFLSRKVDELGLKYIMTIENSDGAMAEAIISDTETKDQKIMALDSMQSVTSEDIENGITYLGIMEDDLKVLKEALG